MAKRERDANIKGKRAKFRQSVSRSRSRTVSRLYGLFLSKKVNNAAPKPAEGAHVSVRRVTAEGRSW